jgi:hypothetical protein
MKNSKELQSLIDDIQSKGRYGDTILAHINPQEANLLKSLGGSGTINPKTGLPEFWGWKSITRAISNPIKTIKDIGSSIDDAIISPVVETVKEVGSKFDDTVLKTIKDAGSSIEDEFDRALADPVFGPIITVVASVYGGPAAVAALKYKQTGELSDALEAGAKAYIIQNVASAVMAPDPNAVGSVTGPDNIDVGGGFNPAVGATAAELEAARLALEPDTVPTVSDITNEIAGPELLGEAGGNTFPLDTAQEGLIPLGDTAGATTAEIAAAKIEMAAKNLTFKDALNYVRGGLLINSLTGDPLRLGGDTGGGGGGGGSTGFAQVPIPADWRSPTYAASSAPIDLSSIFTDQNLLGGTQWQGLPQQQNVSFNDIFASGQQRTPMGQPVNINRIIDSITGQNTTNLNTAVLQQDLQNSSIPLANNFVAPVSQNLYIPEYDQNPFSESQNPFIAPMAPNNIIPEYDQNPFIAPRAPNNIIPEYDQNPFIAPRAPNNIIPEYDQNPMTLMAGPGVPQNTDTTFDLNFLSKIISSINGQNTVS